MIEALYWERGVNNLIWRYGMTQIHCRTQEPVDTALTLPDGSGVAVIFLTRVSGVANAAIYNGDGTLRVRLQAPPSDIDSYYYFSVNRTPLRVVLHSYKGDVSAELDTKTGLISDIREAR
jgi:hypothetical protein